jgi:FMN phosphatase YigB (HAD superfamily)
VHPLLARFSAVLLDLNGTFMFGHDRLGPDEDFHATYRALGGRRLAPESVRAAVSGCCAFLDHLYRDDARRDTFPSVAEALRRLSETRDLPSAERMLLERVIAEHEVGRVPAEYADVLRRLARTHRLGIVSNVWSRGDLYVEELRRVGVLDLFAAVVFSSDGDSIKPSRVMFDRAVAALGFERSEVVVVGDSLRCDVGGAAGAGLASAWIDSEGRGPPGDGSRPDWIIRDLRDLLAPPP